MVACKSMLPKQQYQNSEISAEIFVPARAVYYFSFYFSWSKRWFFKTTSIPGRFISSYSQFDMSFWKQERIDPGDEVVFKNEKCKLFCKLLTTVCSNILIASSGFICSHIFEDSKITISQYIEQEFAYALS